MRYFTKESKDYHKSQYNERFHLGGMVPREEVTVKSLNPALLFLAPAIQSPGFHSLMTTYQAVSTG